MQSIKAYGDGLALEPANETLAAGLSEVEAVKARGGMGGGGNPMGALGGIFSSPDVWAKLGMNPSTRPFLQQPDFVTMLQAVQANPSSLGQYMSVRTRLVREGERESGAAERQVLSISQKGELGRGPLRWG